MKQNYAQIARLTRLVAASLCVSLLPVKFAIAGAANDFGAQQDSKAHKPSIQTAQSNAPKLRKDDTMWGFSSAGRETIDIQTSSGTIVKAIDVDGFAYVGDMMLGKTALLKKHGLQLGGKNEVKKSSTKAALIYPSSGYKWTNGIVPVVIASNLGPQATQDLYTAIDHWNNNTNVKLIPWTNQANYVVVQGANSCSSAIGMQGGAQYVNLGEGCGIHGAIHEFGHALGFSHEHTRTDRDNYVQILWNNMDPNMAYNFQFIDTNQGNNHGSYDYYSIMHYPTHGFSVNGGATLWPYNPNIAPAMLGNLNSLSAGDIAATAAIYGSSAATYYGYLNGSNDYNIQPDGSYFEWSGGQLTGILQGPQNADFDLALFMWQDGWVQVDSSTSNSSYEHISAYAPNGLYYYTVSSYQGSGNYSLTIE